MADFMSGLLENPAFMLGINMLGQGTGYHSTPQTFGSGAMAAFQQTAAQQQQVKQSKRQQQQFDEQLKQAERKQKFYERLINLEDRNPSAAHTLALQSGDPELQEWGMKNLFPAEADYAPHTLQKLWEAEQKGLVPEGTFAKETAKSSGVNVNIGPQGPQFGSVPQGHVMTPTQAGGYQIQRIPGYQADSERGGQAKAIETYKPIGQTIETMKGLIDEHGPEFLGGMIGGEEAARMQALHSQLMLSVAAATGQGALQEADRQVIEGMLPDPTSAQALRLGKKGLLAKYNQVQEYVESKMGAAEEAYGGQQFRGLGAPKQPRPIAPGTSNVQMAPEGSVKVELSGTKDSPAQPAGKAEFDRLPSGSYFVDPEGNLRRKP